MTLSIYLDCIALHSTRICMGIFNILTYIRLSIIYYEYDMIKDYVIHYDIMIFILTLSMINDIKENFECKCEHEYADGLCICTVR